MRYLILIFWLVIMMGSCKEEKKGSTEIKPVDDSITGTFRPKPVTLDPPRWMPRAPVNLETPLTEEGIALGRMLFYDPILSRDSTLACAGCHKQELAFTDGRAFSPGIRGELGKRSAMSLANLIYNFQGMFWDGRSPNLEDQVHYPVLDHFEMDDTWDNIELKLRRNKSYPQLFLSAFGIYKKSLITRELVIKAIVQFERTLISANSRYDRLIWGKEDFPTDEEQRGLELFFFEYAQNLDHPGCSHCHFNPLFTDNNFHNNGIDSVPALSAFKDLGRFLATENISDLGRFRTPSLRNIELTAPYMHDGRFRTLEEVLDSYSKGGHGVSNEDPNIRKFTLKEQDKKDLISFLKMLTDTSFVKNPAFSNPFKR